VARLAIALAVATVLCILLVDEPVARWVATHDTHPGAWGAVLHVLEFPLGIEPWEYLGAAVLTAGVIATQLRWKKYAAAWLFVAATHLVSRNVMMWAKFAFGRLRPHEWHGGPTFFHGGSAFPSGHVMLFASLVLPLVVLFPRARPLLVVVGYAMVARVMVQAHFVSDCVAGLAMTLAITSLFTPLLRRDSSR
jgi:membrane-associated phospholipid phosphatase